MCFGGGRAGGGRSKGEALAPPTDSIQFKNTAAPSPPDPHGPTIRSDTLVNTFSETKAPWNTVAAGKPSLEDMGATEERPGGEPRAREGRSSPCREKTGEFLLLALILNPEGSAPTCSLLPSQESPAVFLGPSGFPKTYFWPSWHWRQCERQSPQSGLDTLTFHISAFDRDMIKVKTAGFCLC